MKNNVFLSVLLVLAASLLSFKSYSQTFEKIKDENLKAEIMIAKKFSEDFLRAQNKNQIYTFKNEATNLFKTTFSPELQKTVSADVKRQLGEYKSSEYAETWVEKSNSKVRIYRFKGDFTNSKKKVEIRTVLDENNKVAGFFVKPWSDVLQ